MPTKTKPFQSPPDMLRWQWRSILEELNELQRHLSDPSCPCVLADAGEYCAQKHALGLHTLAKETIAMAPEHAEMLEQLAEEALDQHNALNARIVCNTPSKTEKDTVTWSRQWRKRIEPMYYHAGCKVKMRQDAGQFNSCSRTAKPAEGASPNTALLLDSELKKGESLVTATLQASRIIPKEQLPFDRGATSTLKPPPAPVTSCPPVCPTVPIPPSETKFQLFPYQAEGYAWLKGRTFALLADDMGLGKTPQAIYWGKDTLPALVIVPAALVWNWHREITTMWRPRDTVQVLDGKESLRKKLPDWTVLSYGMLDKYLPALKRAGFKCIIIDEAHNVKNLEAQRTKNVLELVSPQEPESGDKPIPNRLAVTGTPVLNRPIELFALLVFLGQKKRSEVREFMDTYTEHRQYQGRTIYSGAKNLSQLHAYLKGFMLRRMKPDVLKDLPPKTNTPMFVGITNADEYREAERNFLTWLRDKAGDEAAMRASKAEIITQMNKLRELAAVGKVPAVCDWLKPCSDGQGKVIIFSSFLTPLESLRDCKPSSVIYTGANSSIERQAMVDQFQRTPDLCYFLGTVGAAGVGITLTAANRVAFLDLPWTPGGKYQAEDRAYRIGQTRPVEVVNILAKGTIDERMLGVLAEKEKIISQAVDGKSRDEAETASISGSLMESFLNAPNLSQSITEYQREDFDPIPYAVSFDDLSEIAQGFRQKPIKPEIDPEFRTVNHTFRLRNKNGTWIDITAESYDAALKFLKWKDADVDIKKCWVSSGKYGSSGQGTTAGWGRIQEPAPAKPEKKSPAGEKVSVAGVCETKDPASCEFVIRRRGKEHVVTKKVKTSKVTACHVTGISGLAKGAKKLIKDGSCATMRQVPVAKITGSCTGSTCSFRVKGLAETKERTEAGIKDLEGAITDVINKLEPKTVEKVVEKTVVVTPTGQAVSSKTFAPGISTSNRYEFEFKVMEADDLIVSHNPFDFTINPAYIAKLQPRKRERMANQLQVKKIAANLDPEKLLLDTKALDTGSPIIGPDNIVECGNGRVIALMIAAKEFPGNIELYKHALGEVAGNYGLDPAAVERMTLPVLVRLRLTPVDRQAFAEECNARPTIETSAIEKARTDADKITPTMLQALDVLEDETIEKALRSDRNKRFVTSFLEKLPQNEQALLIDARGFLNTDGIRRMVMAIFAATFKGDAGISLAEKFFEVLDDNNVKNAFNGILKSLGMLAQAENLVSSGQRDAGLAIGDDLARSVSVFSAIRGAGMTVPDYLAQTQLWERQLTPFQEKVLVAIGDNSRSAKRIGQLLSNYAQAVIDSPPPGQASMIADVRASKEELFDQAVRKAKETAGTLSCGACFMQLPVPGRLFALSYPKTFEAYKMTFDEFIRKLASDMADRMYQPDEVAGRADYIKRFIRKQSKYYREVHRRAVANGMAQGYEVPLKVRAEYPDLIEREKVITESREITAGSQSYKVTPTVIHYMNTLADRTGNTKKEYGMDICDVGKGALVPGMACTGAKCSIRIKDCAGAKKAGDYHTHPHIPAWGGQRFPEYSVVPSGQDLKIMEPGTFTCVGSPFTNNVNCFSRKNNGKGIYCPRSGNWGYLPEDMPQGYKDFLEKNRGVCTGAKDAFDFSNFTRKETTMPKVAAVIPPSVKMPPGWTLKKVNDAQFDIIKPDGRTWGSRETPAAAAQEAWKWYQIESPLKTLSPEAEAMRFMRPGTILTDGAGERYELINVTTGGVGDIATSRDWLYNFKYLDRDGYVDIRLSALPAMFTEKAPGQARLFQGAEWLAQKIDACNLAMRDVVAALRWKPLRKLVEHAVASKAKVTMCSSGFVYGIYQVTIDGLTINADEKILDLVKKTQGMKQVHTPVEGQRIYEVVVPANKGKSDELTWTPQEVSRRPARAEGTQAAMFGGCSNATK